VAERVATDQPALVVEVGVAAGTSSAALLAALDQLPPPRRLYSVDVRPTCYFDASKATGSAVDEMYPTYTTRWIQDFEADARKVGLSLGVGTVDFAFIDANHHHPFPLLDVLHLAPVMRPGAWIALHDIELPRLYPQFQSHGPMWLFECWPGPKIRGEGDAENIGAVQMPADLETLAPMAVALLDRKWEGQPAGLEYSITTPAFAAIHAAMRRRRLPPPGGQRVNRA
jgi:hypothetical protein